MEELAYRLALEVRAESVDYSGRVEISARDLPASLALDSVGHEIQRATAGPHPLAVERGADPNLLRVSGIPAGSRSVTLEFTGTIDSPGVRGFYVSPLGPGRLVTTYFEPTGARRLFPCLDRPDAKAKFTVEVTAPAEATVISNSSVETSEHRPDGRKTTRFHPTPPMSTYLLYVGIGPFEELAGRRRDPRVIVATSAGQSARAGFALEQGARALDYFTQYYAEPYPLPKLHLIAVPQIGTGAMENWGAIAFQEYLLLLDDRSPISARMRAVEVICHEVAHQWFGNLVTMRWWNDLWLNESFASFVAIQASAAMFPQWSPWDEFLATEYAGAMLWDALPHTHPIRVDVQDPSQIRQIFDEISYGKGASVLRMAEAYVGEAAFRAGVSRYLAEHRWGNAESTDLWRAVAAASEPGVAPMFSAWVDRPGFPVVRAELENGSLRLEQRRFSLLGDLPGEPWPIPLRVKRGPTIERRLFDTARTTLDCPDALAIVNPERTGFYRVQYEGALWDRVLDAYSELSPIDRWAVVNDRKALFLAGAIGLPSYLDVFRRLAGETDEFVATELVESAQFLYPLVHRIPAWEAALREVVVAQSERLGLERHEGESDRTRALRSSVQAARTRLDPPFATRLAARYPDVDSADPELVRPILGAYAMTAGEAEYAELRRRLAAATEVQARRETAGALGLVPRDAWLREGLETVLTGELLLGPWFDLAGSGLFLNPDHAGAYWAFLTERIEALLKLSAGTGFQGLFLQVAVPLLGIDRPEEMRAWAARQTFPESARGVAKGFDLLALYLRAAGRPTDRGAPPNTPPA